MRYVVLDTETTGLEWREGHRIIEIGCVELIGRQVTEQHYHQYINPEREVDQGAYEVHGISNERLADEPVFKDIVWPFLDFVKGSTLIIHNASFDIGFLNAELERLNLGVMDDYVLGVIDSLQMAREMFPGKRNNLDALCDRLGVNNGHRTLHGALLDSEILGEVYLAMTRGQEALVIEAGSGNKKNDLFERIDLSGLSLPEVTVTEQDAQAHQRYLLGLDKESKGQCVWSQLFAEPEQTIQKEGNR